MTIESLRTLSTSLTWLMLVASVITAGASVLRVYVDRWEKAQTSEVNRLEIAIRDARVAELESITAPRTITAEQSATIRRIIESHPPASISVLTQDSDYESQQFGREIAKAFEDAGWDVQWSAVVVHAFSGTCVGPFPECPVQNAVIVGEALQSVGVKLVEEKLEIGDYMGGRITDVAVFVGQK